jgi:circadian clock protein KaiC
VRDQISTRRLRVVKYRGSNHGTNEYPFLIDEQGISVLPITSLGLTHHASDERISTGIPRLDTMLGAKGYFRGSSVLLSGTAGTGKSSVAAAFVNAVAGRGEKCLYFAFEESPSQIMRNMRSISIDLEPWVKKGLLQFHAARPSFQGLEMHLLNLHDAVKQAKPSVVIIDPVTNLISVGNENEVKSMLTRIIDFFKTENITALFTSLTAGDSAPEQSEVGVSSLMDTWILLRNIEFSGERNRGLYILKSRGMPHSNQVREFILSNKGINLVDVYVGPGIVLLGSARVAQEAKAEATARQQGVERRKREIEQKRQATAAQIAALRAGLDAEVQQVNQEIAQETLRQATSTGEQMELARQRMADQPVNAEAKRGQRKNGGKR